MEVDLDNSATTRVFPEVAELMVKIMCEDYGNPSSLHLKGVWAEQYLRQARESFARLLKVNEKEIFFTSGGTESDNLAIMGCEYHALSGIRGLQSDLSAGGCLWQNFAGRSAAGHDIGYHSGVNYAYQQ